MSMTHDEIREIVTAHQQGKQLQRWRISEQSWEDWNELPFCLADGPKLDLANCRYRIKPEPPKPREWWIRPLKEPWEDHLVFDHPPCADGMTFIHVREVLPDEEKA